MSRRRDIKLMYAIAAAVLAVGMAIAVWLAGDFPGDDSLARLQRAGVIRIGYAVEAPYAFLRAGGEVTGESPEVAKEMVRRLGIRRIEWRQVEFGLLLSELEAGRIDAIAAGMFITPERARKAAFSTATFRVRWGLLVRKGNPRQLHSYQQAMAQPEIKIAAISGAVEEEMLRSLKLPESQLVVVPDALTGRVAVESGVADGLALSSPTVQWMAARNELGRTEAAQPFAPPVPTPPAREGYGAFAFRRGDRRLLSAWNAALRSYLGSPEHRARVGEFGFTPAELPDPAVRTEDLVK